jgi:hypothetical protein
MFDSNNCVSPTHLPRHLPGSKRAVTPDIRGPLKRRCTHTTTESAVAPFKTTLDPQPSDASTSELARLASVKEFLFSDRPVHALAPRRFEGFWSVGDSDWTKTPPLERVRVFAQCLLNRSVWKFKDEPQLDVNSSIPLFVLDLLTGKLFPRGDLWLWSDEDIPLLQADDQSPAWLIQTIIMRDDLVVVPFAKDEPARDRINLIAWLYVAYGRGGFRDAFLGLWGLIYAWEDLTGCFEMEYSRRHGIITHSLPAHGPSCALQLDVSGAWIRIAVRIYDISEILASCAHLGICESCMNQ